MPACKSARRGSVDEMPRIDATDEENSSSRKVRRTGGNGTRHSIAVERAQRHSAGPVATRHSMSQHPLSGLDDRRSYFEVRKNEAMLRQENERLQASLSAARASLVECQAELDAKVKSAAELETKLEVHQVQLPAIVLIVLFIQSRETHG